MFNKAEQVDYLHYENAFNNDETNICTISLIVFTTMNKFPISSADGLVGDKIDRVVRNLYI